MIKKTSEKEKTTVPVWYQCIHQLTQQMQKSQRGEIIDLDSMNVWSVSFFDHMIEKIYDHLLLT